MTPRLVPCCILCNATRPLNSRSSCRAQQPPPTLQQHPWIFIPLHPASPVVLAAGIGCGRSPGSQLWPDMEVSRGHHRRGLDRQTLASVFNALSLPCASVSPLHSILSAVATTAQASHKLSRVQPARACGLAGVRGSL